MLQQLKQSESAAARRRVLVELVDYADGWSPETGVTSPTVQVSKVAGTWVTGVGPFGEVGSGVYYYEFTAGELDTLGVLGLRVVKGTQTREFPAAVQVVAFDPYDAVRLGLTALPNAAAAGNDGLAVVGGTMLSVNVSSWGGGSVPAPAATGVPRVDVRYAQGYAMPVVLDGSSQAALRANLWYVRDALHAGALSTLDAAGIRTAVGLAAANLDTQLDALPTAAENASALASTANLHAYAPATGSTLDLYGKDSYAHADGRGIPIARAAAETHWPATLSTVEFYCEPLASLLEETPLAASLGPVSCTVTQATGSAQALRLELTGTQMRTLTACVNGYAFFFIANRSGSTVAATLRSGVMTVRAGPGAM